MTVREVVQHLLTYWGEGIDPRIRVGETPALYELMKELRTTFERELPPDEPSREPLAVELAKIIVFEEQHGGAALAVARRILQDIQRGYLKLGGDPDETLRLEHDLDVMRQRAYAAEEDAKRFRARYAALDEEVDTLGEDRRGLVKERNSLRDEVLWLRRVLSEAGGDARFWSAQWEKQVAHARETGEETLDIVKTALAAQCDHHYTGCIHDQVRRLAEEQAKPQRDALVTIRKFLIEMDLTQLREPDRHILREWIDRSEKAVQR